MGKLVRCISTDGTLTIMAADTTDIVEQAHNIHSTSAVCSAALGRLLTAACFMGSALKGKDNTVTLRMNGGGPAGSLLAVSDSEGNVRGCINNPFVELPLNSKGKLDVAGALGTEGDLTVIKDLGMREPYIGRVPIVSGEIAEDITNYHATSEQVPTVCALGVLVDTDLSIKHAGGFIIQLLPTADDEIITGVEKSLEGIESVTQMLEKGMSPEDICRHALRGFELEVLDSAEPEYRCNCSRERVSRALISMGKAELESLAQEKSTEVSCQFCTKKYSFTPEDIRMLLEESS